MIVNRQQFVSQVLREHRDEHLLNVGAIERNRRYRQDDATSAVNYGHVENCPTDITHDPTTNSRRFTQ